MQKQVIDQLLTEALHGNRSAESKLLQILLVRFTLLAKLRVGEEDAEDLAQEACITVLQKYKTLADRTRFASWAYTILRNKIGNYITNSNRKRKLFTSANTPEAINAISHTTQSMLLEKKIIVCLRKMLLVNNRYARVLNFVHQGYTVDEICSKLKINKRHLYVLLHRSRSMLSDCLKDKNE